MMMMMMVVAISSDDWMMDEKENKNKKKDQNTQERRGDDTRDPKPAIESGSSSRNITRPKPISKQTKQRANFTATEFIELCRCCHSQLTVSDQ